MFNKLAKGIRQGRGQIYRGSELVYKLAKGIGQMWTNMRGL